MFLLSCKIQNANMDDITGLSPTHGFLDAPSIKEHLTSRSTELKNNEINPTLACTLHRLATRNPGTGGCTPPLHPRRAGTHAPHQHEAICQDGCKLVPEELVRLPLPVERLPAVERQRLG